MLSILKGIVYDHDITQHIHCVMLLCFLRKKKLKLFCYYEICVFI